MASKMIITYLLKGNMEVVAPISAPMLQMVPIPVADRVLTPGPKYSTIAPVPPINLDAAPQKYYNPETKIRGQKKRTRNFESTKQTYL